MKVSGIYSIANAVNGKAYIGSAVNISKRWAMHKADLVRGVHHSQKLQRAWSKYGAEAFTFSIVEVVQERFELIAHEQRWLNAMWPDGYNISPTAGSPLGVKRSAEVRAAKSASMIGKKRPPETVEKMRLVKRSPEAAALAGAKNTGRKVSEETREKIRLAALGRKNSAAHIEKTRSAHIGRKHSPETIEKMRIASIGKKKSAAHAENIRLSWISRRQAAQAK